MEYRFILYREASDGYTVVDQWTDSFDSDDDAAEYICDYNCMMAETGCDEMLCSPDIPFETCYEYKILTPTLN